MPIHNGIQATLCGDGGDTISKELRCWPDKDITAEQLRSFSSWYIRSPVEGAARRNFQINVELDSTKDVTWKTLTFEVRVDNVVTNLRNCTKTFLQNAKSRQVHITFSHKDLQPPQTRANLESLSHGSESCVELRIVKTEYSKVQSITIPKKDRAAYEPGQLKVVRDQAQEPKYYTLREDLAKAAPIAFVEDWESPLAVIKWYIKSQATLENLGILRRSPVPPFKFLPNEKIWALPETKSAAFLVNLKLTKGMTMVAIERCAFQNLERGKKAGESVVFRMEILTLRVLAHTKNEDEYHLGAIKAVEDGDTQEGEMETSRDKAGVENLAYDEWSKLSDVQRAELCLEQTSWTRGEIQLRPNQEIRMYGTRRIMEKKWFKAMIQVLTILAEKEMERELLVGNH